MLITCTQGWVIAVSVLISFVMMHILERGGSWTASGGQSGGTSCDLALPHCLPFCVRVLDLRKREYLLQKGTHEE
jgi:hypothetical protein